MNLSFPVSPGKVVILQKRMQELSIKESDLTETFVRSGGKGGQNVNKVSTAVRLLHIPTGEEVKCSINRTQGLNRYKARVILCDRLEARSKGNDSKIQKNIIKIQKSKKDKLRKQKKKSTENLRIQDLESDREE
ncbi:peptide chain release factor family protein [Leptospira sp. GIMC2001]|uniref:peptide chain release factor family protein n=1 Tax=Leptospira sp. GIMC2001 TaxID=1513297 RepID=UPI00234ACC2B|nr:peptide chain release factor-like protein [Leptospira sp. GIMC2001]WCL50606.1 peptide chain release factor-like protein [Leptospira sp. GIMC2001]